MKNALLMIIIASIFLQSCSTYKLTATNNMKEGKNYVVKLKEGKTIKAKFEKIASDSIYLRTNGNIVKFPTNKIEHVKREKLSIIRTLGGGVLVTAGVIILLDNAKDKKDATLLEQIN